MDGWTGKVKINVTITVEMVLLICGLYFSTLFATENKCKVFQI